MTRRYLDQRLRLSLLRAVDAVEAHRSLLAASIVLGITQPALTKSLHELEDIVGARLFDRHSRGVRPAAAIGSRTSCVLLDLCSQGQRACYGAR